MPQVPIRHSLLVIGNDQLQSISPCDDLRGDSLARSIGKFYRANNTVNNHSNHLTLLLTIT